jgi:hypothetical protein
MDIQRSEKPQTNQPNKEDNTNNTQHSGGSSTGQSGMLGPILVIVGLIAVALVLVFAFNDDGAAPTTSESGPAAVVGDTEIERSELQEQLSTLRSGTSTQAQRIQQLSETRQQSLILSNLIDRELLLQAAGNAGVTVSDQEVDSRLQSQIQQLGTSTFENRLQQNGLTRAEVKTNLRDQMIISSYVSQSGQVAEPTDQEVQQLYDQYSSRLSQAGTSTNVPSLEELRPQLEASIQQRKQRQAQEQLLQQARQSIDVEVMLEGVSYPPETQSRQQGQRSQGQRQPPQSPEQPTGTEGAVAPAGQGNSTTTGSQ